MWGMAGMERLNEEIRLLEAEVCLSIDVELLRCCRLYHQSVAEGASPKILLLERITFLNIVKSKGLIGLNRQMRGLPVPQIRKWQSRFYKVCNEWYTAWNRLGQSDPSFKYCKAFALWIRSSNSKHLSGDDLVVTLNETYPSTMQIFETLKENSGQ